MIRLTRNGLIFSVPTILTSKLFHTDILFPTLLHIIDESPILTRLLKGELELPQEPPYLLLNKCLLLSEIYLLQRSIIANTFPTRAIQ